jgi:hypothetical protein
LEVPDQPWQPQTPWQLAIFRCLGCDWTRSASLFQADCDTCASENASGSRADHELVTRDPWPETTFGIGQVIQSWSEIRVVLKIHAECGWLKNVEDQWDSIGMFPCGHTESYASNHTFLYVSNMF